MDKSKIILDVHGMYIVDPIDTEDTINQIVGGVTNGLFAKRSADILLLATDSGVKTMRK